MLMSSSADGRAHRAGITHDGDAGHGTEAGNWKDFVEKGYSALKGDHRLDKTSDSHVRAMVQTRTMFRRLQGSWVKNSGICLASVMCWSQ